MDEANAQNIYRCGYWCASRYCFGGAVHIDLHDTQKVVSKEASN